MEDIKEQVEKRRTLLINKIIPILDSIIFTHMRNETAKEHGCWNNAREEESEKLLQSYAELLEMSIGL
jgi:hypothetical protein